MNWARGRRIKGESVFVHGWWLVPPPKAILYMDCRPIFSLEECALMEAIPWTGDRQPPLDWLNEGLWRRMA